MLYFEHGALARQHGHLGIFLGPSGASWGLSGGLLGASRGPPPSLLGVSWRLLEPPGASWGLPGVFLRAPLVLPGVSWGLLGLLAFLWLMLDTSMFVPLMLTDEIVPFAQ